MSTQNYCDILSRLFEFAPIAQQVERIHGKDEVASSNLTGGSIVSRSKHSNGIFLFLDADSKITCPVLAEVGRHSWNGDQPLWMNIMTPVAARVARQAPMATVRSDLSQKLRIRATAKPAQAVGREPVA